MWKIDFSGSCAIPDTRNEFLYVTGNHYDNYNTNSKQVTQYGPGGFIADLPELKMGRWDHACAGYYDDLDHFVLLVAGGMADTDAGVNIILLSNL